MGESAAPRAPSSGAKGGGNAHRDPAAASDPVAELLAAHGLSEYAGLFRDNGFDELQDLVELSESDLQELGVAKMGHRRKLLRVFEAERPGASQRACPPAQPAPAAAGDSARGNGQQRRPRSSSAPGSPRMKIRTQPRQRYGGAAIVTQLVSCRFDAQHAHDLAPYVRMTICRTRGDEGIPLEGTLRRSEPARGPDYLWDETHEFPFLETVEGHHMVFEIKSKKVPGGGRLGVTSLPLRYFAGFTDATRVDDWFPIKADTGSGARERCGDLHLRFWIPGGAPSQVGKAFKVTGVKMDTRKLVVHVIEGRVPPSEKHGPRTTYVKLALPNHPEIFGETSRQRKRTKPRYEEVFEFFAEVRNTPFLLAKLKVGKAIGNKTLGVTKIPLLFFLSLKERCEVDQWFPVRDREGAEIARLRIRLEVAARDAHDHGNPPLGRIASYRRAAPAGGPASPQAGRASPPAAGMHTPYPSDWAEEEEEGGEEGEEGDNGSSGHSSEAGGEGGAQAPLRSGGAVLWPPPDGRVPDGIVASDDGWSGAGGSQKAESAPASPRGYPTTGAGLYGFAPLAADGAAPAAAAGDPDAAGGAPDPPPGGKEVLL